MSEDLTRKFGKSDSDKLDLILLTLQRLQQDLHVAKCQIKTSIRDVARHQNVFNDSLLKLHLDFRDIDERLHGLELNQDQPNSST